jgi:cysteine desulfurase
MGMLPEIGMGAVRFSLGRGTTREEIDAVVDALSNIVLSHAKEVRLG